jgi:hypothetical protein
LVSIPFDFTANTEYMIRLRANSTNLSAKVWAYGDSEPTEWTLTASDSSLTASGWSGVFNFFSTTHSTDFVGIGTNGDTAPVFTVEAAIQSVTPLPISVFEALHQPPIYADIDAISPVPLSTFEATFSTPPTEAEFASTTPVPTATFAAWHTWTIGINPYRDAKIYQLRLEKAGLAPLILPATNISVRSQADGRQSSITATIPDLAAIDAIADRASGGVLIFAGGYKVNGEDRFNDILTLPFTAVRPDEGPRNKSLTLTASGAAPAAGPKTVTVAAVEYQSINGLKRLLRMPVDVNLYPGDTVVNGTSSWTVGEVVYALGEGGESMTVTEA